MTSGLTRRRWLALFSVAAAGRPGSLLAADELRVPDFRVAADGWGVAEAGEVRPVLALAAQELYRWFPGRRIERFVVLRGRDGPITHYQRNAAGEIVMKLDTQDRYWSQYVYQFAHEFCHVLCGFDDDWKGNNWFEETICEVASLFVLRAMSRVWAEKPPWENLRGYAPRFSEYAKTVMDGRTLVGSARLDDFYRRHASELAGNPVNRELNGSIAGVLLGMFEAAPESWEALGWLNSRPSPAGETFADYLNLWNRAVPGRLRPVVREIMRRFGIAETEIVVD